MDLLEFIGQAMKKRRGLNLMDVVRESYPGFKKAFQRDLGLSPYFNPELHEWKVPYEMPEVDLLKNPVKNYRTYVSPDFEPIAPVGNYAR